LPLGAGEDFDGVIDLIEMKALTWPSEKIGDEAVEGEIPEARMADALAARDRMVEAACEMDDVLLTRFVNGEKLDDDEIRRGLRRGALEGRLTPVLCGSAFRNKGVRPLLDGVLHYLPSPLEVAAIEGTVPGEETKSIRKADDDAPFAALVFKIMTDPFVGHLAFVRVYSGSLESGMHVYNPAKGKRERIGRLLKMHANKREEIKHVWSGDIAAVVGLRNVTTGETICDEKHPILLEAMDFPEPVIRLAIEPKTKIDQEKLSSALAKLTQEDPTFQVGFDHETGQTVIAGMGELHLEILVDRLQREFSVGANVGKPHVAYRETIRKAAEGEMRFSKQTGGRGQFAHVKLRIEPAGLDAGFVFDNNIKGGAIPREFVSAIEAGCKEIMDAGVLASYQMRDVRVDLYDGSFHEVDSSEMAFKIAGAMAFREACLRAHPLLLEPMMRVEVTLPEEYTGDVIGDLNARRAKIQKIENRQNLQVIRSLVPMAEMFGYATDLRSATQGRGNFTMQFGQYEKVPKAIGEEVVARVTGTIGR
jgi:elongation factor G